MYFSELNEIEIIPFVINLEQLCCLTTYTLVPEAVNKFTRYSITA